jgi:hypothetical protein
MKVIVGVNMNEFKKHTWLLNDAQEIVNEHLKERYEKGELSPLYKYGSYLDVIQIFNYSLEYWNENTINQELFDLIIKIKVQVKDAAVARRALKFIAQYIIETNSILWWDKPIYRENLKGTFQRYFPLEHKPMNYDYLRYVINKQGD